MKLQQLTASKTDDGTVHFNIYINRHENPKRDVKLQLTHSHENPVTVIKHKHGQFTCGIPLDVT